MNRFLVLVFLFTLWGRAEEGVFLQNPTVAPRVTIEAQELVLRHPLVKRAVPRAKGILLVNSETNSELVFLGAGRGVVLKETQSDANWGLVIHIILDESLGDTSALVVVLGDTVFLNIGGKPTHNGGWISLPVPAGESADQCLQDAMRVFSVDEQRVFDLRLSEEERTRPANVRGQLPEQDINEIRQTVFAMARWQILEKLTSASPEAWVRLLSKWPGRHSLTITPGGGPGAGVYYAPNAGYQLEKVDGKWVIVGG